MASSDNLMAMDPSWMFRNAFPETWLPESFSRETETLTKALQKSFETQYYFDNINFSTDELISPWYLNNTTSDTTTTISGASAAENENNNSVSGLPNAHSTSSGGWSPVTKENSNSATTVALNVVTSRKRSNNGVAGGAKIVKRKSRASKRATTTFINADVANFRELVQEVTGVKFGGGEVVKPEPLRGVNRLQMITGGGGGLPTLDTSAFLLDPAHRNNREMVAGGVAHPEAVVLDGGSATTTTSHSQFDSFCSFPTLESWKAI